MSCVARVLQESRQSVQVRLRPRVCAGMNADELLADQFVGQRAGRLHLAAPALPDGWQTMPLSAQHCDVEVAIHILARRRSAAGYRKITARTRRAYYVLNHKKTGRLLKAWGFLRSPKKPHPRPKRSRSISPRPTSCGRPTRHPSGAGSTTGGISPPSSTPTTECSWAGHSPLVCVKDSGQSLGLIPSFD